MDYKYLELSSEETVGWLFINRPEALNALNADLLQELREAIREVENDKTLRVLVISGRGEKAFVAGADIKYMQPLNPVEGRAFGRLGQEVFRAIEKLPIPVIAAVNGFALGGGCELAMAADIRLAADKAKFGQPEVSLGITPGYGGTQRLTRLVGEGRAMEMVLSGSSIDAEEAYRIGLINHVYPADQLLGEARKLAQKIAANAPLAVQFSKAAINRGLQTDIDTAMTIEADLFGMCFSTEDQKSGMLAFLKKEKPVFKGC